jgi:hypothetical protein
MSITQKSNRFRGTGRIISIQPSSGTPTTAFESYQIQSEGLPASSMHPVNPILKPGTNTALDANAVFFEPTETYRDGSDAPIYSQLVINTDNNDFSTPRKISEYKEYFTVTDPGEMGTQGFYALAASTGSAQLVPRAISQPKTYPREGLVEVFLTTSNDADTIVAYNDENVSWCGISFVDFYSRDADDSASQSASYRTFSKYLRSTNVSFPATNAESASTAGVYSASATSTATGDTTYTTTGIFRSKVVPFLRTPNGTQLYLKTNVTFS